MKETYWGYWLVLLGVFIIGVMLLVNNLTTTSTQDYYNIKEVTQASMIDSIDFSYYRLYGNIKISEQKFVENFLRRFAENVNMTNEYDVDFYDLYEVPPKVSVKISTGSNSYNIANTENAYDVVTTISAVLELGTKGEGTPEREDTCVQDCIVYFRPKLLKYFRGEEVDGYRCSTDSEVEARFCYGDQLSPTMTVSEFTEWYKTQSFSSDIRNTKYENLPDYLRVFAKRRWVELDKVDKCRD